MNKQYLLIVVSAAWLLLACMSHPATTIKPAQPQATASQSEDLSPIDIYKGEQAK